MTLVPLHDSHHTAAILFKPAAQGTSLENCNASMLSVSAASWRCIDIMGREVTRGVTASTFGPNLALTIPPTRFVNASRSYVDAAFTGSDVSACCQHLMSQTL